MLKELYISNFALIDEQRINFVGGFNVFTGETGSGKSIILDALSLVLGKRADRSFIRKNQKKSVIEAVFFLKDTDIRIKKFLDEEEIDFNGGTVFLRRELFDDGHSTSRINGKTVTIAALKVMASMLLSIHEQNEFDEIMLKENQLEVLDLFSQMRMSDEYLSYGKKYEEYTTIDKKIQEIEKVSRSTDINREMDILDHQIAEIEHSSAFLKDAENIGNQIEKLEKAEAILTSIHSAYDSLYSEKSNVLDSISSMIKNFEKFSGLDKKIDEWLMILQESFYALEDLARTIKSNADDFAYDESLLEELLQQNNQINKVFSKYGSNYDEVMEFYRDIVDKRKFLSNLEEEKGKLFDQKSQIIQELSVISDKMTKNRKEAAAAFEAAILEELRSLGMVNARFQIDFLSQEEYGSTGRDQICFMVSFNKGEDVKPFNKVASGGEISRFVLSLKKVTAGSNQIKTMVFDEIDSGISGISAYAVGKKLKEISRNKQVICITHLPQVAANADFHYLVSKYEDHHTTYTRVKLLREEMRVEELGKMISGDEITSNALNYARELIEESKLL